MHHKGAEGHGNVFWHPAAGVTKPLFFARVSFLLSIIAADGRQLEDLVCPPPPPYWSLPGPESSACKASIITLISRGPYMTCWHIQSHFNMVLFKDACVLHIVSSRQAVEVFVFLLIPNFHIRKYRVGSGVSCRLLQDPDVVMLWHIPELIKLLSNLKGGLQWIKGITAVLDWCSCLCPCYLCFIFHTKYRKSLED